MKSSLSISSRVRKAFHQLGLTDYEMRAFSRFSREVG